MALMVYYSERNRINRMKRDRTNRMEREKPGWKEEEREGEILTLKNWLIGL